MGTVKSQDHNAMTVLPDTQSPPTKRKRASRPKVKTGCIVCKIRRVKCDETKPACLKCTSTGRKCDGYVKRDEYPHKEQRPDTSTALVPSRNRPQVAIPRNPHRILPASDSTQVSFEFFRLSTAACLERATGLGTWTNVVLQLSQSVPAVRLAGAAVGSVSRRMRLIDVARNNGSLDKVQSQAMALENTANSTYAKALTSMREQLSKAEGDATEAALVACWLLQTYEFLKGDRAGSLLHQINGMAILIRHLDAIGRKGDNRTNSLRAKIIEIFRMWDQRTSVWLGLEAPLMNMVVAATNSNTLSSLTQLERHSLMSFDGFENLEDAAKAQRQLLATSMFLNNQVSYWSAREGDPMMSDLNEQRISLLGEANTWRLGFEAMKSRTGNEWKPMDIHCANLLDLSTRMVRLRALTMLQPDEDAIYASQNSEFTKVLDLADSLLFPTNLMRRIDSGEKGRHDTANELPLAYFNLGLIQSLFHIAVKCSDPLLRDRALDRLERDPWDEGGFNSAQAARIARKSIGLPDQMAGLHLVSEVQPRGYYHHAHLVPMISDKT